jgi:hypothetical protein
VIPPETPRHETGLSLVHAEGDHFPPMCLMPAPSSELAVIRVQSLGLPDVGPEPSPAHTVAASVSRASYTALAREGTGRTLIGRRSCFASMCCAVGSMSFCVVLASFLTQVGVVLSDGQLVFLTTVFFCRSCTVGLGSSGIRR